MRRSIQTIDRSRKVVWFRGSFFKGLAAAALAIAASPVAIGVLVYLVCLILGIVCAVPRILGVLGMVIGAIAAIIGLFAGIVGCIPGLIVLVLAYLLYRASATAQQTGKECIEFGARSCSWFWNDAFIGAHFWAWPWALVGLALVGALAAGTVILLLRASSRLSARTLVCAWCGAHAPPLHRCSGCSGDVDGLEPSVHGVLSAHCGGCKAELPTTDWFGRAALVKACSACRRQASPPELAGLDVIRIGLAGATGVGKTSLLVSAVSELMANSRLKVDVVDPSDLKWIRASQALMRRGEPPEKTLVNETPAAIVLAVRDDRGKGVLLCLHDVAGEASIDDKEMSGHRHHARMQGVILVVDPHAERALRPRLGVPPKGTAVSDIPAQESLTALTARLESILDVNATRHLPVNVAVVLTKGDAGAFDATGVGPVNGSDGESQADSDRIRSFLRSNGMSNFVDLVESRYRKHRYFVSSALGRSPEAGNSSPLISIRALDPVAWLVAQAAVSDVKRALRNAGF